jgi:hypothetical protein
MELLLNLTWLLLALPAYWMWQGRRGTRRFSSLQCLMALGFVLVVLFPVVSATDDLRALRAEMEESPGGKRNLRQSGTDRASAGKWLTPVALNSSAASFVPFCEGWQQLSTPKLFMPATPEIERAGRAPPLSFLG